MAAETAALARLVLDAYNRWAVEPVLAELDPEIEWRPIIPMLVGGEATVYRGHDGVRRMFGEIRDSFGEIRIELDETLEIGDRVVGIGHMHARGSTSGVVTDTAWAFVAELRDGKALRIQTYMDHDEALADAGAPPAG
jgi:ketosteroid isomerase-like protein